MRGWQRLVCGRGSRGDVARQVQIQNWSDWITYNGFGISNGQGSLTTTISGSREPPIGTFESYVTRLFLANPIVWSAVQIRKAVFSQATFKYQRMSTGQIFGDQSLRLLEQPYPGGSTPKLLKRMLLHNDFAGNAYVLRVAPDRLQLMRPDWVTIVMGSAARPNNAYLAEDAELIGYLYSPPSGEDARLYLPDEVAHFSAMPDPLAHFRGLSWLTPVISETLGDKMMAEHKLKFFEQGASPNMVIKFDPMVTVQQIKAYRDLIEEEHGEGIAAAYKTMYLGGGADPILVGSNFQQLDFSKTIGKAETRILMAAGVHPVIAGASEGLAGASLNAGNFSQVRRIFSDIHLQDLWTEAAASLQTLLRAPLGTKLVMDGRQMPFLQDDAIDKAEIQRSQGRTITNYMRDGITADSAIAAVANDDLTQLVWSGLNSVQLQPPGTSLAPTQSGRSVDAALDDLLDAIGGARNDA